MPSEAKRLAKWTDRYDVIQGSRLDFDGGAFFWQYQLILSLGIPNPSPSGIWVPRVTAP